MKLFGFDTSDPGGLQSAIRAAEPVFQIIENRLEGIISTNLDRLNGATITIPEIVIKIHIPTEPRATPVE